MSRSLLVGIVDFISFVLVLVGLCINWLEPTKDTPEGYSKIKIDGYGSGSLRRTCKSGTHEFNMACLTYQGSVIMIVFCSFTLLYFVFSILLTIFGKCKEENENEFNEKYDAFSDHFIFFTHLIIAIIAYAVGSSSIRSDLHYKYGAGFILVAVSLATLFISVLVTFFIFVFTLTVRRLIAITARLMAGIVGTGGLLTIIGLCTSFYTLPDQRINALKHKYMVPAPNATIPSFGTSTELKDYCGMDGSPAKHLCNLYKSSAILIAFSVLGCLAYISVNAPLIPVATRIASAIASTLFFVAGFVQYALVGEKVRKDLNMSTGLGWNFYLVGTIFIVVGNIGFSILIKIFGNTDSENDDNDDDESEDESEDEGKNESKESLDESSHITDTNSDDEKPLMG